MRQSQQPLAGPGPTERNSKKQVYTQVLYSEPNSHFPFWKAAEKRFPDLAYVIALAKMSNYRDLAISNQKAEANIVIRTVIPLLAKLLPGVQVLTVHDSLLAPEAHAKMVAAVLSDAVAEAIGLKPKLNIKYSKVGVSG